jgi:hypothetical protein
MFDSVDEMVEESDRRHLDDSLEPEDVQEPTLQYAVCLCFMAYPTCLTLQSWDSQARVYRGYEHLVRLLPTLKIKLVDENISELNGYFRDVGYFLLVMNMLIVSIAPQGSWWWPRGRCCQLETSCC